MSRRLAPVLHAILRSLAVPSFVAALSLAVIPVSHAAVAPGTERAFAGSYQLSAIEPEGNQVKLTILLTLRNPSTKNVSGGIVAVLNSQPHPVLIGSFNAIDTLPQRGQVTVSQTFTISAAEYANWKNGHAPVFEFLVTRGQSAIAEGIQTHQVAAPPKPND